MNSESCDVERVCVLNGIHRGAVISVGEHSVLVGGGDDCDALLSDESVGSAAIRISHDSRGRLSATAVRGVVGKNGRTMRLDRPASFGNGSTITLGDVKIVAGKNASDARHSVDRRARKRTLLSWGSVCVVSLALFGLFGAVGGSADAYNASRLDDRTTSSSSLVRRVEDPMPALRRAIEQNDLSGRVTVQRKASGQVIATGAVSAVERDRWNRIVRWFDGRYGDRAALESRVTPRSNGIVLPFEIVSILASPNPRIVIQNGDVFPVGSILPGGWAVDRIADMTVVLTREDRELAIDF